MEAATEVEDDAFYADLNKQVSLLIMDDHDEDPLAHSPPSVHLQGFSRAKHPAPAAQSSLLSYQQIYRRESKGTGVFIPQSSHPRRKNRQGRMFSSNSSNTTRGPPPPHASSSTNNPSHNSFNPSKRC